MIKTQQLVLLKNKYKSKDTKTNVQLQIDEALKRKSEEMGNCTNKIVELEEQLDELWVQFHKNEELLG